MSGFLLNSFNFGGITFTFLASSTSTQSSSCSMPASIAEGDLALYLDVENIAVLAVPAAVTPSGFTLIRTDTASAGYGARVTSSYKLLVGTEGGTSIAGISFNTLSDKIILVFRPSSVISDVTVNSLNGQAIATTPTNQSLTMSNAPSLPVIGIATYGGDGAVTTRGDSAATMVEVSSSSSGYAKYVIYNKGASPVDSTISMNDTGVQNCMQSFYLTFT